jgi:hypothetical protein
METTTKDYITKAMLKYLSSDIADGYGQLKTMDVYRVFNDRTKENVGRKKTPFPRRSKEKYIKKACFLFFV